MIQYENEDYLSMVDARMELEVGRERLNALVFVYDIPKYLIYGKRYYKKDDIRSIRTTKPKYITLHKYIRGHFTKDEALEVIDESKAVVFHGNTYYPREYLEEVLPIEEEDLKPKLSNVEQKVLDTLNRVKAKENFYVSEGIIRFLTGFQGDFRKSYKQYCHTNDRYDAAMVHAILEDGYEMTRFWEYTFGSELREKLDVTQDKFHSLMGISEVKPVRLGNATLYSPEAVESLVRTNEKYLSFYEFSHRYNIPIGKLKGTIPEKFVIKSGRIPLIDTEPAAAYYDERNAIKTEIIDETEAIKTAIASARISVQESGYKTKSKGKTKERKVSNENPPPSYKGMSTDEVIKAITSKYFDPVTEARPDIAKTIDQAREYVSFKLYKRPPKNLVQNYSGRCSRVSIVLNALTKDLEEYTVEEQTKLMESLPSLSVRKELVAMLKYFDENGRSAIVISYECSGKYDPYSNREWLTFVRNLTDLKRHVPQAEMNYLYAQAWLLMLCHTFLAWRIGDYIKFPRPTYIIDDGSGVIDEAKATVIANSVRRQCQGLKAEKTGADLNFPEVPRPMLIPFATAISICMMHNPDKMFSGYVVGCYRDVATKTGLFKALDGFDFYSMKANKTIETGVWEHAIKLTNINTVAYTIAAGMRAHKVRANQSYATTTERYIMPKDNFNEELQQAICKRGLFGFNVNNILNILTYGNADSISFEDKTKMIVSLNERLPQHLANDLADKMNDTLDRQQSFYEQWKANPDIMAYNLMQALQRDSNSKLDSVVCCNPNPGCDECCEDCRFCFYGMFTIQALPEIARKTLERAKEANAYNGRTDAAGINSGILARRRLARDLELVTTIRANVNESLKPVVDTLLQIDSIKKEVMLLDGRVQSKQIELH